MQLSVGEGGERVFEKFSSTFGALSMGLQSSVEGGTGR